MPMARFAEVVFNLPVNQSFFYDSSDFPDLEPGKRVMVHLGRRKLAGFVISVSDSVDLEPERVKPIEKVIDDRVVFTREILGLASWLSVTYMCSLGEALGTIVPGGRKEVSVEFPADEEGYQRITELSEHQRDAIEKVLSRERGFFYLNGVTGSGKTEVYLQIADRVLRNGGGVIYLVPEIALSHQIVEILRKRFGEDVVVLHSGLTPSQRLNGWMRLLEGKASVAVGARSSVFAPVKNLRLIIIDEEHEAAYKSGFSPRYHARQVAMYRSRKEGAILVMGSATPSLEAYHYMRMGKIEEIVLPERLSGGDMPSIQIIDMRKESLPLSRELIGAIREVHDSGNQSILFLNRRGFAYFFHCRSCGYEMKCKNCSVPLTYHKSRNEMVCHYCGYRTRPIEQCPDCGSLDVGYSGFGTERIEDDVERLFPDYSIERIDSDSARNRSFLAKTLAKFRDGGIDILLGTQMVAKGLHFPGVKLVGIILVDTDLRLPDFRSQEKTFQLLVQVAGRAGRVVKDARVIIQTYDPENWVIRMAARGELKEFYQRELELRRELSFPPFFRIIRIVFRGRDKKEVFRQAEKFSRIPFNLNGEEGELLGPAECPLSYIARNHRVQLIIRGKRMAHLHRAVSKALRSFSVSKGIHIEVDVDPVSLL